MSGSEVWSLTKQSFSEWTEDRATRLAAALAFWTMLSIAPLLIITIKVVGVIFGQEAAQGQLQGYLQQTAGPQAAEAAQQMIASAGEPGAGVVATIISIGILIWSASYVFIELQDSLNTLWEVKPDPEAGFMLTIRKRLFSMGLVLCIAFLLIVSLVASTVLGGILGMFGGGAGGILGYIFHEVVSLAIFIPLFALMFKYLPDVKIGWRYVWIGAVVTGVLFVLGKNGLSFYLGRAGATSMYGAAGSLVALLLWVYYSSLILFFGAEFTQVYAKRYGEGLEPEDHAVRLTPQDRAQRGIPDRQTMKGAAEGMPATAGMGQAYRTEEPEPLHPPHPGIHYVWRKPGTISVAMLGLAAGAVVGGLGALTSAKRRSHDRAAAIRERIARIEGRVGHVEEIRGKARATRIIDHLREIEARIRRDANIADYIRAQHAEEDKLSNGEHKTLTQTGRELWRDLKHVGEKLRHRVSS
jgi:membrane protein